MKEEEDSHSNSNEATKIPENKIEVDLNDNVSGSKCLKYPSAEKMSKDISQHITVEHGGILAEIVQIRYIS